MTTNGQVIPTREHYETHRSCREGIESVPKNAATAEVEDDSAQQAARAGRRTAR